MLYHIFFWGKKKIIITAKTHKFNIYIIWHPVQVKQLKMQKMCGNENEWMSCVQKE